MDMNTTLWKDVPGYEGVYEVSNTGRIRRVGRARGATPGRILTVKTANGYSYADLSLGDKKVRYLVHRLVALAFLGLPPTPSSVVNHKNCDKLDNRPENLEWTTYLGNARHAVAHGRVGGKPSPGESNGRAKLTHQQALEIRALRGIVGARELARRYGVSRSAIQFIHQGKHWRQQP